MTLREVAKAGDDFIILMLEVGSLSSTKCLLKIEITQNGIPFIKMFVFVNYSMHM